MKVDENMEKDERNNVVSFPSTVHACGADVAALQDGLLHELLAPLRASDERKEIKNRFEVTDEVIEEALLQPELRARLTPCVEAYSIEQLPKAIVQFYGALAEKESWAYKILLDAIGFPKLVGDILPIREAESEVAISGAFERDIVQKMLDRLRGREKHLQTPEEAPKDNT